MKRLLLSLFFAVAFFSSADAQESVARQWNDVLLECIRNDFARPTVHARNLHHTSMAMFDAFSAYSPYSTPYFASIDSPNLFMPSDLQSAQEEAISFAMFVILKERFKNSPGAEESLELIDNLMLSLGYDLNYVSTAYQGNTSRGAAALGNYIADQVLTFGQTDGSNEANDYANLSYSPINDPLAPKISGNPDISDPNRWQPLSLDVFIDQAGNAIPFNTPPFLSPEWGAVTPFALKTSDLTTYTRNGFDYKVYHDMGSPPLIDYNGNSYLPEEYKWGFALVSVWSAMLDPSDGEMVDISPNNIGNIDAFPSTIEDYRNFYDLLDGGDDGTGWTTNPSTGQPYASQMVPRGDYTRVLAEFWADGPDSETPPGHWFTLLNEVNDNPLLEKKFLGEGQELEDLEWDVRSYFMLGGAMHDAAITAWGNKGYYDYPRPVSAIRYMADRGQSSDQSLTNYDPNGIPLVPGYIEVVTIGDALAGSNGENVNKIKVKAWKGPDYIQDPATDVAGVDWILAENWWPYQRPSFVTPPFAGYVSGHSTYSRAAAEVLTRLTGDPYFPGGMGEFEVKANEFLVFEEGPSVDFTLQWATYRDASDQCSLSRIWGGIHPPADDIPGRKMGEKIGNDAVDFALQYIDDAERVLGLDPAIENSFRAYPNPADEQLNLSFQDLNESWSWKLYDVSGSMIGSEEPSAAKIKSIDTSKLKHGLYILQVTGQDWILAERVLIK